MAEHTKISFNHRKDISDYSDLVGMLFPGNRNQQHAAVCIFFELKWANSIVPNLAYLEKRYNISRRILQRTRAKLSRLGLIEYVSYLNSRYGGQYGWKLSSRFETALKQLAAKCAGFRDVKISSKEKELMLTVALPLPDGSTANIGYSHKPTHLIRSVNVQNNDEEDIDDVTEALLYDKRDISLNQVYEMLVLNKQEISTSDLSDSKQPEQVPQGLAEQTRQLPEQAQNDISVCVEQGLVTVAFPLPDGRTTYIHCDEKIPHFVQAVYVKSNGDEDAEDVTSEVFAGKQDVTLNQVYEKLINRNDGKESKDVDAGTV